MSEIKQIISETRSPEDETLQAIAQHGANFVMNTEYDNETNNALQELAKAQIAALWKREEGKTDEEIEYMRS
jgi:hypothetical protein